MQIGKIALFFEQKRILCAICLEVRANKYHLLSEENREISLSPNRIVQISSEAADVRRPRETLIERLKEIVGRQKALMQALSIKDLWELVVEEKGGFTLPELADLVFRSPFSWDQEMALFRALYEDRIYFRQKGDIFEARLPEIVEQIVEQMEREAEEKKKIQQGSAWLKRIWSGEEGAEPEDKGELIALLKELALYGMEAPNFEKGKALLQGAGITSLEAPFEILIRLKEWDEDENLFLHRHQISQSFPRPVLEEAEGIFAKVAKGISPQRSDRDLTFLHPLTIDSEYTRDIDDALSLERGPGRYQVGIHIADVATFIEDVPEIFGEAMARGTSIYLPDQRIPMIPPALAEGSCSLIVGEKRRALSFLVQLDEEARVQEYQILPGLVQVERRLSYETTDLLLEEMDEELSILQGLAEKLFQKRMDRGAVFIPRPERVIRVSREKEISFYKRNRESSSQKMVAEYMILANQLAAQFLKEKGIPAIYRGQMDPREKVPAMPKFDPLQAYRLRRILNRGEISTRPLKHAGLGTEAYVTLTSPIRRFYDLLGERQILGYLRGLPILPESEVEKIITQVGPTLSKVGLVEELSEQYWILRHLEKRIGSTTPAVILDRFPHRYLIYLEEYLMEADLPAMAARDFIPGDQVLVRVERVQARSGTLKIVPV
jgi:exoribonuclease-2